LSQKVVFRGMKGWNLLYFQKIVVKFLYRTNQIFEGHERTKVS